MANENKIRVRVRESGKVGTIPAENFNSIVFEKLDGPKPTTRKNPLAGIPGLSTGPSTGQKKELSGVQKAGEVLGFTEAGNQIAESIARVFPQVLGEDFQSLSPEQRADIIDINKAGGKETLASFGQVALSLFGPGLIGGGTKLGVKGAAKALTSKGAAQGANALAKTPTARLAAEGAGFGALESVRQGQTDPGEILKGAAGTAALSVATAGAARLAGGAISKVVKNVSAMLSGVPKRAIDFAIKHPRRINAAITEAAQDKNARKILTNVETAFKNFEQQKNKSFETGFNKIIKANPNTRVNFKNAVNSYLEDIQEFGGRVTKEGNLKTSLMALDESEERLLQKAFTVARTNPSLGLKDAINTKRRVKSFFRNSSSNTYKSLILGLGNRIDEQIEASLGAKGAAQLKQINQQFGDAAQFADLVRRDFRIGIDKGNPRIAINALKRAFKDNAEVSAELLEELRRVGGEESLDLLIGHFFKEFFPVGTLQRVLSASIFGASGLAPAVLPGVAAASSPRLVGRTATATGGAQQALQSISGGRTSGAAQTALANLLANRQSQ